MPPKISPLDWDLGNVPPSIAWGGVDEAGRGAWAGPVVAACAVLDRECIAKWRHVLTAAKDSKQLSPDRREALAAELKLVLPAWAVAEVDNLAIDRENILEATLAAMRQSVSNCSIRPALLFVDGDRAPRTGLRERLVVDGDALSCAVACASILAKTHRDALMERMDSIHPGYEFARHKGYGTKVHQNRLAKLGTCAIHRLSYVPVRALQRPDESAFDSLKRSLAGKTSVDQLQAWVENELRPNYGVLLTEWVVELRGTYEHLILHAVTQADAFDAKEAGRIG
jgi:ribonuclease HII